MAELIGCTYQHFNKVLSGYNHIAVSFAKKLHRIGIGGNFIIENAEI